LSKRQNQQANSPPPSKEVCEALGGEVEAAALVKWIAVIASDRLTERRDGEK
jgi:hypothetical protein